MILLHIQLYIINFLSVKPSMITFSTSFFILSLITTQLLTVDTSISYVKCRYFSNIRILNSDLQLIYFELIILHNKHLCLIIYVHLTFFLRTSLSPLLSLISIHHMLYSILQYNHNILTSCLYCTV